MANFAERRKYQRCTSTICKALMSTDSRRWSEIDLFDISAGGLRFVSQNQFPVNMPLQFQLKVYNMLSEFNMRVEGHILRSELKGAKQEYSVKFDDMNKYTRVQLDELIKSKVSVKKEETPVWEDGIYTFMLIPRVRSVRVRNRMRMLR